MARRARPATRRARRCRLRARDGGGAARSPMPSPVSWRMAHTAMARTSGEASPSSASILRQQARVARVAGGDQHVAQEAVAAGALDRRAGKARAEGARRRARAARRAAGCRSRRARAKRASRAAAANLFHGQTARQSSQPNTRLPMGAAELGRDVPLVLDRQVGEAAARIELIGRRETRASGRRRGSAGSCRSGRPRARRARARRS